MKKLTTAAIAIFISASSFAQDSDKLPPMYDYRECIYNGKKYIVEYKITDHSYTSFLNDFGTKIYNAQITIFESTPNNTKVEVAKIKNGIYATPENSNDVPENWVAKALKNKK